MTEREVLGRHFIMDAWGVTTDRANDPQLIKTVMIEAIDRCGATLIEFCIHPFNPVGLTATATLAESHMAIHTWPEKQYVALDLFFCGRGDPEAALTYVQVQLQATYCEIRVIDRGRVGTIPIIPNPSHPNPQSCERWRQAKT